MRVLIACERSGTVRLSFERLGHEAWSCDLAPSAGNHYQQDVLEVIGKGWDLMVAHPPCTHLSVSGACRFKEKQADGRQQAAIDFFMALVNAPIERIAVENPICIMSTRYRKPDQIIQPWQFGHDASKSTCLWLKNLPKLELTGPFIEPRIIDGKKRWANQTDSGQNRLGPSPERAAIRATTYTGIAEAMAKQWSERIAIEIALAGAKR